MGPDERRPHRDRTRTPLGHVRARAQKTENVSIRRVTPLGLVEIRMITQKHKHNMGLRGFQFYTTSPRGIFPPPWQAADHPNSQWIRPLEEEGIVSLINFLTGVKVEL